MKALDTRETVLPHGDYSGTTLLPCIDKYKYWLELVGHITSVIMTSPKLHCFHLLIGWDGVCSITLALTDIITYKRSVLVEYSPVFGLKRL